MELPVIKRLKKELQELMHELNIKLPKELQEAAAHGDLAPGGNLEADLAEHLERRAAVACRVDLAHALQAQRGDGWGYDLISEISDASSHFRPSFSDTTPVTLTAFSPLQTCPSFS